MAPGAPHDEIRAAYRQAVRELHPDTRDPSLPAADADAALRLVQGAWDVLGDARLRQAYDARLVGWRARPQRLTDGPQVPGEPDEAAEPTVVHFPWWLVALAVLFVIFVFTAYASAPTHH